MVVKLCCNWPRLFIPAGNRLRSMENAPIQSWGRNMSKLKGAMTAMITPFDESGALNLEPLQAYLDFQKAGGIDGLVVCGTNGEGTSLSVAERKQYLEAVMERRGNFGIIAGTGANNLPDTLELTRHAGACGVDAVLVLPSFFFKNPPAQGVADFFKRVLDASDVPVFLYSIPHQTAIPITDEILAPLKGHPRLAGLKDSEGRWERTQELITGFPDLSILPGSDELLVKSMQAGAVGCISGTANSFPELVAGVKKAVESNGDVNAAQDRLNLAKSIVLQYPLIGGNKSVLANRGVPRMYVRPPLINLTQSQETEMMARLNDAGLLN
jgi:4-hydroxy-tetrahydrodipicolinate synthase